MSDPEQKAEGHRVIQREQHARSKARGAQKPDRPVQAGARRYPAPPFPNQHQPKPGDESKLDPAPMYEAPYYEGSNKLKDKVALITGGDSGIGRAVAVLFAREGADVAVVYLSEHNDADVTKKAVEAEGRRCLLISGDVSDRAFCQDAVEKTVGKLGKLDVLVNNAAFQCMSIGLKI